MSEELIVRHCSPTLAGLKTANMFSCSFTSKEETVKQIRALNRRLSGKGIRVLPLRYGERSVLIYIYRPKKLKDDLRHSEAESILKCCGYSCHSPEKCIVSLIDKLKNGQDFPHEIGLFLGYPAEDVRGFIEHGARTSKLVGHWRVYGDEERARKAFAKFKKCTEVYTRKFTRGNSIDKLTVSV